MSEPETLATGTDLTERLHRHRFDRIIMLSDGIFAISATLAALEIRLPEHAPDLATVLREGGRDILIYILSFFIIAALWFMNRELFARLQRVDTPATLLTLALLCMTALIPAVTHNMHGRPDGGFAAYLLTMGVCGTLNAALWIYAAARRGLMLDEVGRAERWTRATATLALPLLTLPMLAVPMANVPTVIVPLVVVFVVLRRIVAPRIFGKNGSANREDKS